MSWEVHSEDPRRVQSALLDSGSDRCEHVEENSTLAAAYYEERDSFGTVSLSVLCRACEDARQAVADEESVGCRDCHKSFPRRETLEWRWFDFDGPQGDEPLVICCACWDAPKHRARRERDRREQDAEFGIELSDDC